jgi:hypothetical protein
MSKIDILIRRKNLLNMIPKNSLVPNTSKHLQTILSAEVHLEKGQFLLQEQALNKAKSLICRAVEDKEFPKAVRV